MSRTVASEEIAAFRPLAARVARRYNGLHRAEFDDLEQVGLIAIWEALKEGFFPTQRHIERRAINWVNYCRRQGFSGEE